VASMWLTAVAGKTTASSIHSQAISSACTPPRSDVEFSLQEPRVAGEGNPVEQRLWIEAHHTSCSHAPNASPST
jgi:hypothetical protein